MNLKMQVVLLFHFQPQITCGEYMESNMKKKKKQLCLTTNNNSYPHKPVNVCFYALKHELR